MLSVYETMNGPKYVRQNGMFNYRPFLQVWLSIRILKKDEYKSQTRPTNRDQHWVYSE
jgi:hypothetical protein